MKINTKFFLLSFLLIIFDQISKFFLSDGSLFLKFVTPICNKNIAWGISIAPGFFYFIWIAVFLFLAYFFLRSRNDSEKIALTLILSGAFSNMADRLARGCVVDFIDLKFWPVFNLADIYIAMGIIILFAIKILNSKR